MKTRSVKWVGFFLVCLIVIVGGLLVGNTIVCSAKESTEHVFDLKASYQYDSQFDNNYSSEFYYGKLLYAVK